MSRILHTMAAESRLTRILATSSRSFSGQTFTDSSPLDRSRNSSSSTSYIRSWCGSIYWW